jgi:hypothetical protein
MSSAAILLFALLCMNVMLGVLVLAVARGDRSSVALRLWGWGLLTYAGAQVLLVVPNLLPPGVRPVLGNGLISLSAMLTVLGVYEHTPIRVRMPLVL